MFFSDLDFHHRQQVRQHSWRCNNRAVLAQPAKSTED
jgi:hypothetical protein